MQIHELNNLAEAGQGDYLALDTGADTGKVSVAVLAGAVLEGYTSDLGGSADQSAGDAIREIRTAQSTDAADIDALETRMTTAEGDIDALETGLDAVGWRTNTTSADVTLTAGTWTTLATLTLKKGTYILNGYAQISGANAGGGTAATIVFDGFSVRRQSAYCPDTYTYGMALSTPYVAATDNTVVHLQGWCSKAITLYTCVADAVLIKG